MYPVVLVVHSWLRYLVFALGIGLLVVCLRGMRKQNTWTPTHTRLQKIFLAVLDTQMTLGLLLYFVWSPFTTVAFRDLGAAMKIAPLRFFSIEHIFAMVVAIAIAHVVSVRARRKQDGARHRLVFIGQVVWLLLTLSAIPWPVLDVGRPLFRL